VDVYLQSYRKKLLAYVYRASPAIEHSQHRSDPYRRKTPPTLDLYLVTAIMGGIPQAEKEYQLAHLDESRAPQMIAADMSCLILSLLSTAARFISKRIARRPLRADDYTILVGTIVISGFMIGGLVQDYNYGFGRHDMAITADQFLISGKVVYIVGLFYSSAYYLIKISILLLYHRIFAIPWYQKLNGAVIALNICIMISMFLVSALSCLPVPGFWDYSIEAKCIDSIKFFYAQASINAVTDVIILLLPLPVLWRLLIDRKQKLLLSLLFMLGGATCVVSIIRVVLYLQYNPWDINWSYIPPSIATDVEICLAVICANLPTYRPIAHAIFDGGKPLSCFLGSKIDRLRDGESPNGEKPWFSDQTSKMGKSREPKSGYVTPQIPQDHSLLPVNHDGDMAIKKEDAIVAERSLHDEEKAINTIGSRP
jgi:hypothetical protein